MFAVRRPALTRSGLVIALRCPGLATRADAATILRGRLQETLYKPRAGDDGLPRSTAPSVAGRDVDLVFHASLPGPPEPAAELPNPSSSNGELAPYLEPLAKPGPKPATPSTPPSTVRCRQREPGPPSATKNRRSLSASSAAGSSPSVGGRRLGGIDHGPRQLPPRLDDYVLPICCSISKLPCSE